MFVGNVAAQGDDDVWQPRIAVSEKSDVSEEQQGGATKPTLLNGPKPAQKAAPDLKESQMPVSAPERVAPAAGPAPASESAPKPEPAKANNGGSAGETTRARLRAEEYCRLVLDQAILAKLAEEKRSAADLQSEIEKRLAALEKATAEHEHWLRQRKEFQEKAQEAVVRVYSTMAAEAAAQRLAAVSEEVAAAILSKLASKNASAILGEMDPQKVGRLTVYMTGLAELTAVASDSAGPTAASPPGKTSEAGNAP